MKAISAAIVILAGAIVYASGAVSEALGRSIRDAESLGLVVGFVGGIVWIAMLFQPSRDRDV